MGAGPSVTGCVVYLLDVSDEPFALGVLMTLLHHTAERTCDACISSRRQGVALIL